MTTPTDIELQRARFEAWHIEYRSQELTRHDDTYYNAHARCRWEGWQACCTDQIDALTAERDAFAKAIDTLNAECLSLTQERDALRTGLEDAIECVKSWGAYASPYFRNKWDLDADIKRLQTLLEGEKP